MAPEPLKPEATPLLTVMSSTVKPVTASEKVIVTVTAPEVPLRPLMATVGAVVSVSASVMLNSARLSVPEAPPPRPVPLLALSVPRLMSTVSPLLSVTLSVVALRVRVAVVAVAPLSGPVKVTVALPLSRF